VVFILLYLCHCIIRWISLRGDQSYVSSAWMFHQAQDAGGKFNPINFLSYPYYVFALEGFFFACFFWGILFF